LAEKEKELLAKIEECIGLHAVLDDLRAKHREVQGLYTKFSDRCAQLEQQLANKTMGPSGVEQAPWAAFLRARLRLIHEWAKDGIPGNGKRDAESICAQLNHHDPTQIMLLMSTPVEPAPLGSHAADLQALREAQVRLQDLEQLEECKCPTIHTPGYDYHICGALLQKQNEELKAEMEEMRTADSTELAARILNLKQQLRALQSGERVCWHCYDVLNNDPDHCEKCPAFNQCSEEGCTADGCVEEKS
jgi:hypothetical protein